MRVANPWKTAILLFSLPFVFAPLAGCDLIEARGLAREGNEAYLAYDYRKAIEKYLAAAKINPQTPNLYLNLGYSYFSIFDPASDAAAEKAAATKAVEAFEKHLAVQPDDDAARVFQIKTLIKAAPYDEKMADRALATFLAMLEKDPKDHEARQYLITLFIDCQRYEDAVAFFQKDLAKKPDDVETMKILAIIADKSKRTQEALEWYWKRATAVEDAEKKAVMFYEVGTYAWNLLHYQPDRVKGVDAIKLADQGIEACRQAMALKAKYAEAMIYANLLFLKRALFETDEQGRAMDQLVAFELRKAAGQILMERKKAKAAQEGGQPEAGSQSGDEPNEPEKDKVKGEAAPKADAADGNKDT